MNDSAKVNRREFIAAAAAAGACLCGMQGCFLFPGEGDTPKALPGAYEIAPSNPGREIVVDTIKAPELLQAGRAVKIVDERLRHSIIIANTGNGAFTALSIACTHNQFEVEYKHDENLFRCISINHAEFGLDGKVLKGPTNTPLNSYAIRREADKLVIALPA